MLFFFLAKPLWQIIMRAFFSILFILLRQAVDTFTFIFVNEVRTKWEAMYATIQQVSLGIKETEGLLPNSNSFNCVLLGTNAGKVMSEGFFVKQTSFVLVKPQSIFNCCSTNALTNFFLRHGISGNISKEH